MTPKISYWIKDLVWLYQCSFGLSSKSEFIVNIDNDRMDGWWLSQSMNHPLFSNDEMNSDKQFLIQSSTQIFDLLAVV